jgi:hypothetical protein
MPPQSAASFFLMATFAGSRENEPESDHLDSHTGQEHGNDFQTDHATILWGPRAKSPQLFVQKFPVTLVHFQASWDMAL